MRPQSGQIAVFSKTGAKPFWSIPCPDRLFLVFGSKPRGLPVNILNRYADATYYIPITSATRSLNLSTAAGIALYERLRSVEFQHAWPKKMKD
jgi:tRNA (cytidine/uridine-2'-O-)-methyltransferase